MTSADRSKLSKKIDENITAVQISNEIGFLLLFVSFWKDIENRIHY